VTDTATDFITEDNKMGIQSIDAEDDQFAYRYDTQLLIERRNRDLDEDEISDYITEHFEGNSLIAAGDEDLIKIHFHTNEPWKILEYCSSVGEIFDIVVEDMIRQSNGLQG
jgi:dihydroxyacetone kinase-like predicted kinase